MTNVSDSLIAAVAAPFQAALILYIAILGFMIISGRLSEPIRDTWGRIGKGAAVAFFLTAGSYDQYVRDLFLNGIPNDILDTITGATGGHIGADSFDHIWNKAFAGGLTVWKNIGTFDFGLVIVICLYWFAAAVATAFGFLVWLVSHILLGLFVAVGPLIIGMFLFPATRSIFERWVGLLLSMIFLQVFVASMLTVLIAAENWLLANVDSVGNGNPFAQVQVLFGAIILFIIACVAVVQLPGAATGLAGGMQFHANALARATFGRSLALASRTAAGAGRLAAAQGRAVQQHLTSRPPPGPSMSVTRNAGGS
ncbi:MAG TPA: type IV secretion system protein [Acetobacteraceae bacterium]|nr:type IV secretion system protein [Acetobacteraceae bacterium]